MALISNEAVLNEELDPTLVRRPPTTGCVTVGVSHLTEEKLPVFTPSADRSSEAGGADADRRVGAAEGGAEAGAPELRASDQVQCYHSDQVA